MATEYNYDVFISYSRKDYVDEATKEKIPNSVISIIKKSFDDNGITYWMDEEGNLTGKKFAHIIAGKIRESMVFLFVCSKNSVASKWVDRELSVADTFEKHIIPFICDDSYKDDKVVMFTAALDRVEFWGKHNKDNEIAKLVKSVKKDKEEYEENRKREEEILKQKQKEEEERKKRKEQAKKKKEAIKEIKKLATDYRMLSLQQDTIVQQLHEKNLIIGKDAKECPVCKASSPIETAFCERCGFQFPQLYAIDGNESYPFDNRLLVTAKTNYEAISFAEKEKEKMEKECQRLKAALLEKEEVCQKRLNNIATKDSELNNLRKSISLMQVEIDQKEREKEDVKNRIYELETQYRDLEKPQRWDEEERKELEEIKQLVLEKSDHDELENVGYDIVGEGKTELKIPDIPKNAKKIRIANGVVGLSYTGINLSNFFDNIFNNIIDLLSIGFQEDCVFPELISIFIPSSLIDFRFSNNSSFNNTYINTRRLFYNLLSIMVSKGNSKYDSRNYCNAIIETKTNKLMVGCRNTIIPDSITTIEDHAFYSCSGLTIINIPDSITEIGESAFESCSGLTSIIIPESVTSIGDKAFNNCSALTAIVVSERNPRYDSRDHCNAIIETETNKLLVGCCNTVIPDDVTSIAESSFESCSGLALINIPESVTSIGEKAFFDCNALTAIVVSERNPRYDSRDHCNAIIETETNKLLVGCCNTVIPETVTSIAGHAFYNCSGLTEIVIPNSVNLIRQSAFESCSGLTSINIPNSIAIVGNSVFKSCSKLVSIILPDSITKIENSAFESCSELTAIIIPNGVTIIGDSAFKSCGKLMSISLPNSVTKIGDSAFESCIGLTSISIPNGVTVIEKSVFKMCSGLISISIPSSVTEIEESAFESCSGIISIVIPKSVSRIGKTAFKNCTELKTVYLQNPNIKYEEDTFPNHTQIIKEYGKRVQLENG